MSELGVFIVLGIRIVSLIFLLWLTWTIWCSFITVKVPSLSSVGKLVKYLGKLEEITDQTRWCDLGCGNGRFLYKVIKRYGFQGDGFEIATPVYLLAKIRTWFAGGKMRVFKKDIYAVDWTPYDVIYLYLFPECMPKIEKIMEKYRGSGKVVISNTFSFPNVKPQTELSVKTLSGKYNLRKYVL